MRILWLSHLLPWPPKGGVRQRSYHLLREVSRHHQVSLIGFRQRAQQPAPAELRAAVAALSDFCEVIHVSDLPEDQSAGGRLGLAVRSLLPGPPYTIRWGRCSGYAAAVRKAIRDVQPHLVHFDSISLAPYLASVGDTPSALNHHNIESHMLRRRAGTETHLLKRLYYWQEGLRLARYENKTAKGFALHLVCADLDARRLANVVGKVPTAIVPNGVDLDYFKPPPPGLTPTPDTLIFVGGLTWYPNVSAIRFFFRDIWPLLNKSRPTLEVRIVGRGPPQDLLRIAEQDPRVTFTGFVDDIRPLVHNSSVYICPIFEGGGTKLKMLDAMAMGKAIVAHPVACEGLKLRDGEQVLQASSPAGFVSRILQILDDSALRKQFESHAREHVERYFSFSEIGRSLSRRYARLVEERCSAQPPSPE